MHLQVAFSCFWLFPLLRRRLVGVTALVCPCSPCLRLSVHQKAHIVSVLLTVTKYLSAVSTKIPRTFYIEVEKQSQASCGTTKSLDSQGWLNIILYMCVVCCEYGCPHVIHSTCVEFRGNSVKPYWIRFLPLQTNLTAVTFVKILPSSTVMLQMTVSRYEYLVHYTGLISIS